MKEENNGASKNKWRRIFRKKWFFPALYLTIAAVLLTAVIWYQNLDNQIPEVTEDEQQVEETGDYTPMPTDEEAEPVVDQQEIIQMPVADQEQAEIVTKFYDYNADQEDQESALVLYNNRYYQSTGVGIADPEGETFDVTAALSGSVTEVKEDPLLGNVVVMSHDDDIMTYYAALEDVQVSAGDTVKQGEQIASAGNNLFGQDDGTHVYFELRKDGQEVNPEEYFGQPVSSLSSVTEEASEETEATEESETPGMPDADEENGNESSPSEDENGEAGDEVTDPVQDPEEDDDDPSDETEDE